MKRTGVILLLVMLVGCTADWRDPVGENSFFNHHWQRLTSSFISADGRVIDLNSERSISTSEGQAYGMFLAVVADDPDTFAKLHQWTQQNLLPEQSFSEPPAWLWGQADNEQWQILDTNAAADADVWMAYALFEAGRLWNRPDYTEDARQLANQVLRMQTLATPAGLVLLPGPVGFEHEQTFTVNPSYFSLSVFVGLAEYTGDARWREVYQTSTKILAEVTTLGYFPDWVDMTTELQIASEQTRELAGSYNAIRTYLWIAMEAKRLGQSPDEMAVALPGLAKQLAAAQPLPETISLTAGELVFERDAPIGFLASWVDFLSESGQTDAATQISKRIDDWPVDSYQERYYDTMLLLFGLGYQQCYTFGEEGRLLRRTGVSWCDES